MYVTASNISAGDIASYFCDNVFHRFLADSLQYRCKSMSLAYLHRSVRIVH